MKEAGLELDKSAPVVYLEDVRDMSRAYALFGSPTAAQRKLAIKTLQRCAGRSGEAGWITFDSLDWDKFFRAGVVQVAQTKTSKAKLILLIAGADRHSCWMLDFGDFLATQQKRPV